MGGDPIDDPITNTGVSLQQVVVVVVVVAAAVVVVVVVVVVVDINFRCTIPQHVKHYLSLLVPFLLLLPPNPPGPGSPSIAKVR